MLFARNLFKAFNGRYVVEDVSLRLNEGEIVGLFGPNGAGKTSSFHMIIGFLRPDKGRITIDAEDITDLPMFLRARKGIGYLPQEPSVFRKMTVEDNLISILEFYLKSKEQIRRKVREILETFKLDHLAKNLAQSLSGGERRRLEIARSLLLSPRFILLDEPFSSIDPISISELKKIIKRLKENGIGIMISDHNVRESLPFCDRAYVMNNGRIIIEGRPEEVAKDKLVRQIYLGEDFTIDART